MWIAGSSTIVLPYTLVKSADHHLGCARFCAHFQECFVRFVLYSEKTVAQCLTAINARMHVKESSSRPALDGWVEKSGAFSISMSLKVIGKFSRRTVLKARVE